MGHKMFSKYVNLKNPHATNENRNKIMSDDVIDA